MRPFLPVHMRWGVMIRWGLFFGLLILLGALLVVMRPVSRPDTAGFGDLVKVDEHPLYVMHFQGDYGFEQFLKTGVSRGSNPQASVSWTSRWACTGFAALAWTGTALLGRNFDWNDDPALLLFTDPPDAYASVSMVDLSYLGFDGGEPGPEALAALSQAPYLPFDGMNEKGLAVGMMAVPSANPAFDPQRITLDSLHVIRLMLDYADSVDAAIALLGQYNIDFGAGPPLHYLVADQGGHSAVLEFIDGRMVVTRNGQPWQVATNFILSGKNPIQAKNACERYRTAEEILQRAGGDLDFSDSMRLLADVSQLNTIWSIIYDLDTGAIHIAMGREYGRTHQFKLEMQP